MGQLLGSRDMHRGREGIVGGLRHVDVVVGMDGVFGAHLTAGKLDRAVGNDLVGVHVGLGAAAGLPNTERKFSVEFAFDDLVGGADDELGLFGGHLAEFVVGFGGGLFEDTDGADDRARHQIV